MMVRNLRPASATASSTCAGTGSSSRDGRSSADVSRSSSAAINSACVAPFVHNRPKLVGCSLSPVTRAMTGLPESGSVAVCTSMPQPTPQYEQAVLVTAMKLMVGGQCFGLFSDDVIAVKIDPHRAPERPVRIVCAAQMAGTGAGLPLTQWSDRSGYVSPIASASWLAEACGQFQDSFGSVSDGYVDELAARQS